MEYEKLSFLPFLGTEFSLLFRFAKQSHIIYFSLPNPKKSEILKNLTYGLLPGLLQLNSSVLTDTTNARYIHDILCLFSYFKGITADFPPSKLKTGSGEQVLLM